MKDPIVQWLSFVCNTPVATRIEIPINSNNPPMKESRISLIYVIGLGDRDPYNVQDEDDWFVIMYKSDGDKEPRMYPFNIFKEYNATTEEWSWKWTIYKNEEDCEILMRGEAKEIDNG